MLEQRENLDTFRPAVGAYHLQVLGQRIARIKGGLSPFINPFLDLAHGEFAPWIYDLDRATGCKGQWREKIFKCDKTDFIDLEIGIGNGYFFEHRLVEASQRRLVGFELKYKQIIQTAKRACSVSEDRFRLVRYDAKFLDDIFSDGELNDVYIFFPDPWEKQKKHKHRLIDLNFLNKLFDLQRSDSYLTFKTDSQSYYHWVCERLPLSQYKIVGQSEDLHASALAQDNFQTHFEKLWTRKGRKTYYLKLFRS